MKKQVFHSALSLLLAFSMILMTLFTGMAVSADEAQHLVTVGTVEAGATSITVHCGVTGAKDWIHIFPADFNHSTREGNLGEYKYCAANGDVTYNLKSAIYPGDYVVVMYLNDGYTEGDIFPFTVAPNVTATPDTVELGENTPITVSVLHGLNPNESYKICLFKAKQGAGYSALGDATRANNSPMQTIHNVTAASDGSLTTTESAHVTTITEAGDYTYCVLTQSWGTVAHANFTVTEPVMDEEDPILAKEVYDGTEAISINWNAVPAGCGWAGIYAADNNTFTNYGDYINRGDASFPSGQTSRYKSLTWPLATGDYKIVFFNDSGYTVNTTVNFSVVAPTITVTNSTVHLYHSETVSIAISGGLKPSTAYNVYLYKAKSGYGPENTGFGNSGVDFISANQIGQAVGFTTDANGAATVNQTKHRSLTEPGMYAYCIMENWNTKAVIFVEVVDAATVSLSRTSVPLGANVPLMLKVTAGELGLAANTNYKVRLYGAWNGVSGFGSSEVNFGDFKGDAVGFTTDGNGAASVLETLHVKNISATGNYAYCIQDGFDTKARVFFNVTEAVTELDDTYPQVKLSKTSVALGVNDPITLTVTSGLEMGLSSKYYYVRLYKAKSGFDASKSGFATDGVDFGANLGNGSGVTLNSSGTASATETLHSTAITTPGTYVYVLMDNWDTVGRAFFTVTDHVADTPVRENYVAATPEEDGSYDLVTYCADCGAKLSAEHVTFTYAEGKAEKLADYLKVAAQLKAGDDSCKVRLISMLDNDLENYGKVGFAVTIGEETVDYDVNTVYTSYLGENDEKVTAASYGADYFTLVPITVDKGQYGDKITVVPFVTLADGTRIEGAALSFILNEYL